MTKLDDRDVEYMQEILEDEGGVKFYSPHLRRAVMIAHPYIGYRRTKNKRYLIVADVPIEKGPNGWITAEVFKFASKDMALRYDKDKPLVGQISDWWSGEFPDEEGFRDRIGAWWRGDE
jgi:hypothetical protein